MNLVQRLTGSTSLSDQTNAAISPAARFASIEMTKSPMGKGQSKLVFGNIVSGANFAASDTTEFLLVASF
ncbi:hypothetical protein V6N11_073042 [Hibiscus sabdariffa]|uniref:Uncharacterized protein n=2 Tax=Hibiscus sabdariffa TaxID=183260 RepID=A0ABR2NX21_9ROSI